MDIRAAPRTPLRDRRGRTRRHPRAAAPAAATSAASPATSRPRPRPARPARGARDAAPRRDRHRVLRPAARRARLPPGRTRARADAPVRRAGAPARRVRRVDRRRGGPRGDVPEPPRAQPPVRRLLPGRGARPDLVVGRARARLLAQRAARGRRRQHGLHRPLGGDPHRSACRWCCPSPEAVGPWDITCVAWQIVVVVACLRLLESDRRPGAWRPGTAGTSGSPSSRSGASPSWRRSPSAGSVDRRGTEKT